MPLLTKTTKLSGYVEERIKRGRERMESQAGIRNLCLEFARGNQYLWLGNDGKLYDAQKGEAVDPGTDRDTHRVRSKRNLILPLVNGKVSAATKRIPGYEVLPSTFDPEDIAGARIGGRVALAGYDLWRLRRASQKTVYLALVADEGYAMAYWDSSIGPYVLDEETGDYVGVGDVRIRTLSANQVMSEPGIDFEESPWYAIEYAKPIDELKRDPDFLGVELTADAELRLATQRKKTKNLVVVTEYFERPSVQEPEGKRCTYANKKLIYPEDTYPLRGPDGVIDEPCLHRVSYIIDPEAENDQGLVRHLVDPQRVYLDAINKSCEAKNLALVTQLLAPRGYFDKDRWDDTPGAILEYDAMPGMPPPEWRDPLDPQIIAQLHEIAERAKSDMGFIADANDIPSAVESGKGIQALIEKDQLAWGRFIGDLADWHSRLMRDCLSLVQQHYTEPRLLKFRGRLGWETIEDFKGADLHGQTDVRVLPGSLEAYTREAIEAKVMAFAQNGWISPEAAMSAINGGTAEGLIDSYEKDVARANLILQKIDRGPAAFLNESPRPVFPGEDPGPMIDPNDGEPIPLTDQDGYPVVDPITGQPQYEQATSVPGWMPRPFDNEKVQMAVIEDYLKSPAYDQWDDLQKAAINDYYAALLNLEQQKSARAQAMQVQTAQDLGMANAAKEPNAQMPDTPNLS